MFNFMLTHSRQIAIRTSALLAAVAMSAGAAFGQDLSYASQIPDITDSTSVLLTSAEAACGATSCTERAGCGSTCSKCPISKFFSSLTDPGCSTGPGTLMQWAGSCETGGPNLDEPLITDRPDFTEASSTVGQGVFQLEFGYTYTQNRDNGVETVSHSYGEPLIRYGILAEWLEFRLGVFPTNEEVTPTGGPRTRTSGTEDLYLGFKIALTPQDGILPEMAILPQMTIPSGSTAFTNDETLPGVNWLYSWELCDDVSIAGSTQFNRAVDGGGRAYTEWAQSAAAAFSLTDEIGAYAEWYALFPHSASGVENQHYLNGGFTYLLSNDVQFDVRAGYGLNAASDDLFIGTGVSMRFK